MHQQNTLSADLSTPTPNTVAAAEWIERLDLLPHPEGGWFRETYRAPFVLPYDLLEKAGFNGARHVSTAIYFLLEQGQRSLLHRLRSDEIWHFHTGGPLEIVELTNSGGVRVTRLGLDLRAGETLQHVVPAGTWFGARPCAETVYTLVSCTVSPGFDFQEFEFADRDALLQSHPHPDALEWIEGLTPLKLA